MTDDDRARKLFDWVIEHIRIVASMVVIYGVIQAVMVFGIITNARNGADASRHTQSIIEQNEADAKARTDRSIQDRKVLQDAIQCVLYQLAEHRVTNQAVHDHMAGVLGVDATPATPLPERANPAEIDRVCSPFFGVTHHDHD